MDECDSGNGQARNAQEHRLDGTPGAYGPTQELAILAEPSDPSVDEQRRKDEALLALCVSLAPSSESMANLIGMLESGANPSREFESGWSAAQAAASAHGDGILRRIHACGVDWDRVNQQGHSALSYAVGQGNEEGFWTLIQLGANPKVRGAGGESLLHIAAQNGRDRMARQLIDMGASVGLRDDTGRTPLHDAARFGRLGCVQALIGAKADPSARDAQGKAPADLARAAERWSCAWALEGVEEALRARRSLSRSVPSRGERALGLVVRL